MESIITSDITSDIFFLLTQHIFISRQGYAQDIVDGESFNLRERERKKERQRDRKKERERERERKIEINSN